MLDTFRQFSETDRLRKVLIGRHRGYRKDENYVELVNESQKEGLPPHDLLEKEFKGLSTILREHDVEVLLPEYVGRFVYDQLTPRDIGVTIGNRFLLCNMAKSSRRYEATGIFPHILSMSGDEPAIVIPPDPRMMMEGGDIIVDNGTLFVGITQRTNEAGFQYLEETFGEDFEMVPVFCRSFREKDPVLHLDCVFNPVGRDKALIHPAGLQEIPPAITDQYDLIEVDKKAQQALATNILSLSKDVVISRDHPACQAANEALRKAGIEVIPLPFDGGPSTGGSFRCCTLPLVRE